MDFDIPVHAARFSKMVDCNCFVVVSSVGANSKSKNFYLQLKGEMEEAVNATGIDSIHIMRPSMLLGDRKESRPAEAFGKIAMQGLSFFMAGIFHKYKPIHAKLVAKAMIAVAKKREEGVFIYEFDQMKKFEG